MKKIKKIILSLLPIFIVTLFTISSFTTEAEIPPVNMNQASSSLANMLAKVTPAVVNITVQVASPKPQPFTDKLTPKSPRKKGIAVGSGVIFNAEQGLIVTNAHVVRNAQLILVTLKDGRRYLAKLLSKSDDFDIAVLKIKATHLAQIPFADSNQLKVGNFVAVIGSPFGLTQSVTSGVISALNRIHPQIEGFQSFIQTDAPINMGNSGGALVDMKGHLIGINTAILTPGYGNIGIGFAIPSNMVRAVITQLLKYGKVKRGMLGVVAQNLTPELAQALHLKNDKGTVVTQIVPGSPAATAGIQPQDIIQKLNGHAIRSASQLRNTLGLMPPGTKIILDVQRQHKPLQLTAIVGNPKILLKKHELPFIGGMRLQTFNELEADGSDLKGVIITNIKENSAGTIAGLLPGDVITAANGEKITSITALKKIAQITSKQLLLKIMRGNTSLFVVLQKS